MRDVLTLAFDQPDLLDQTIDQTNAPFRRFARSQFGEFQQSALARYGIAALRVESIAPREHGFVLAHLAAEPAHQVWYGAKQQLGAFMRVGHWFPQLLCVPNCVAYNGWLITMIGRYKYIHFFALVKVFLPSPPAPSPS